MSSYSWKAIPEATWTAFSAAVGGLVGALMISAGASDQLTVAVTVFITAFFRMVVALIAAFTSTEGTISSGADSDKPPIPPTE